MACMPGMGDPTLTAHLTVAAYACAAIACALNARTGRAPAARALWAALALPVVLLGIVEHWDLHMTLLERARGAGRLAVAAGALTAGAAGLALLAFARRWLDLGAWVALAGVGGLVLFVAARAAWFERLDALVGIPVTGPCSYRLGELAALALAFIGARISARRGAAGVIAAPAPRSRGS